LNPMVSYRNRPGFLSLLLGWSRQALLLQDSQNGSTVCLRKFSPERFCNSDGSMARILLTIAGHSRPIRRGNYTFRMEWRCCFIQRALPLNPTLDRCGIDAESGRQVSDAHFILPMKAANFLPLIQSQCSSGMEFHRFSSYAQYHTVC